jgi:hypothetical protein
VGKGDGIDEGTGNGSTPLWDDIPTEQPVTKPTTINRNNNLLATILNTSNVSTNFSDALQEQKVPSNNS